MLLLYYVAQQKYHTLKIDIIWCTKYINIINIVYQGPFVLASNHFRKSFSVKPCVWLCMENRIFWKPISFDRKIATLTWKLFYVFILPSNHFRERERERERERRGSREPLLMTDHATSKAEIAQSFDPRDRLSRSSRSSAEIAEKLMASYLPPKLQSLPSLPTKLMAPITPI